MEKIFVREILMNFHWQATGYLWKLIQIRFEQRGTDPKMLRLTMKKPYLPDTLSPRQSV